METKSFMKKSLANKSVVERVVDQITNAIINGELLPGDKLRQSLNYVRHLMSEGILSGKQSRF